jgi:hypothetical protein
LYKAAPKNINTAQKAATGSVETGYGIKLPLKQLLKRLLLWKKQNQPQLFQTPMMRPLPESKHHMRF